MQCIYALAREGIKWVTELPAAEIRTLQAKGADIVGEARVLGSDGFSPFAIC